MKFELTERNTFANGVNIDINMFNLRVVASIFGKCDTTSVVAKERCGRRLNEVDFAKQSADPGEFFGWSEAATYSASQVDRDTVFCWRVLQVTMPEPRVKQYPLTERRVSGQLA